MLAVRCGLENISVPDARGGPVLCLSNADVMRLQVASTTLLSALDFESVEAWGEKAMTDVMTLLGADKAYFALPGAGSAAIAATGERADDGLIAYLSYFWQTDIVLTQRRVELGLEVYHRDMLYHPGEMARDELHNDWCIPHALHDTLGMGFDIEPGQPLPALLHVYHHRSSDASFGERGVALMQLLLPSFKAGVAAWRRLHEQRHALAASLDQLGLAAAVIDADGAFQHQTPALTALLVADDDRFQIDQAMLRMGREALARSCYFHRKTAPIEPTSAIRTLATHTARYTIRAALASRALAGRPVALVSVERATPPRVDIRRVASHYGLTARESAVSMLLARGESTAAIARALGTSQHTIRHHIEHIMSKLGVHSRTEAVARLTSADVESES